MKAVDKTSRAYLCLKQTTYPDIPANAISRERAFALTAQHLGFGELQGHAYFIDAYPNPVWKVSFLYNHEHWSAEVDCITGEVKSTRSLTAPYYWWQSMVLWEVSDAVDADWVEVTPPSVG